jgi:hypothetical protein
MKKLVLYEDYTRENVHDIFEPHTRFTPQSGTWGIQGIISIADREGDFVLFVTFAKKQGTHVFDEGVTELAFAQSKGPQFCLYRVYEYADSSRSGKVYVTRGDLAQAFQLTPVQFRAAR